MRATLFDFNGVLVDDEQVHFEAFREVILPFGVDLTEEAYNERYLGFDDRGAFAAMLADAHHPAERDATENLVMHLVEKKKPAYMRRIAAGVKVFDGAVDLLRRRASRGVVGIVSGALEHEIEHCLSQMNVRDCVAFIVAAEHTARCKPDPEGYALGLAELRKRGALAAVAIEDSVAGVASARAAGLRCVAVTHSYGAEKLRDAGAHVVVARLADLTDADLDQETR